MATKKGAIPPKKPLESAASALGKNAAQDVEGVISRPGASAVEMRAEKEPAVIISRSQPTLWQKVRMRLPLGGGKHTAMNDQMAAVKAGVMQELETMGMRKGIAMSGSPFSRIMLPVAKRPRRWGKWGILIALALVFLGIIVWFGRSNNEPNAVLVQAMVAIRDHDVKSFEAKVDAAGVATSVVNQMFNIPQQGDNPLAARMTAFVKPGLAEGLKDQILATVEGTTLDSATLLGKIWHDLGDGNLRIGAPTVAMQDEHMAVAELPLVRRDLGLTLPLQVVLNKDADNHWLVVDIPNLAAVMDNVVQAQRALDERRKEAMANGLPTGVRVLSVKKLKDTHAGSGNLVVSMDVANGGTVDAKDVTFEVAFGDAAGQPMMTTRLTLDGILPAGGHREQVWTVPVDASKAAERYVADLPLSALSVSVTLVK